ncbi:MAG: phosphatidate cytidylyltransferase, partial [Synechococcaceae bacterium WBB_3_034]|nr:phosphatidate cytidylyltransferase [Synechococcaceae bacterium WBB_3_034]
MIPPPRTRTTPQRLLSGYAAGGFGLLVVGLGGWWFTAALGVMVHLGLLEYFRLAQFKGIRPASKTTLVLVQLLLITTQWAHGGDAVGVGFATDLAAAVLPISGALICGWLLLQPLTGSIADIAASIFALFYLGFLPSYWIRLRELTDPALAPRLAHLGVDSGMVLMLMACLLIVATDIGSYVLGRRYGRRPLSPISPGKTLEGALGGLA